MELMINRYRCHHTMKMENHPLNRKFFIESAPTSAVWPINDFSLEDGDGGVGGGGGGGGGGVGDGGGGIGGGGSRARINSHRGGGDSENYDEKDELIEAGDDNKIEESQEHSPLISRRAEFSAGDHSDSSFDDRRVQFNNRKTSNISFGATQLPAAGEENDRFEERKRRKSRHQYYRTRKLSHQEGTQRKISESEPIHSDHTIRKVSVQPEDFTLEEADINELTSHRSDDQRALRRPKIHSIRMKKHSQNNSYLSQGLSGFEPIIKKHFDHSPHEIFVQLDELCGTGKDREWKETARWIKYEEDLEEGSDRWGRPHVASLSFHSLINLRRCLETGVVLLDLEEKDLPGVAYRVVEQMVIADLITADDKAVVMRALLLKHRHVNEHPYGFSFPKKKNSSCVSLQTLNSQSLNADDKRPRILPASEINGNRSKNDLKLDNKDDFNYYSSSQEDLKKLMNDTILRRIPQGAEATTVLVGSVEFLEKPTIAFIRLAEGILMPSITEVPVPVRFMFILMGPKLMDLDYHEVGRSIATLMANEHFQEIAYRADDRKELLSAINEFLDDSIVLPPGNWDRNDLLPFEELKAKRDWIKTRKAKALEVQEKLRKKKIQEEEALKLLKTEEKDFDEKKPRKGPLEKTHKWWGGLRNDIKRRYPMYKSDILDGLNTETLAAATFMFFANLSTAITFGGLMSEKTHYHIGISETLLACSIVGVIFHTFAGQPLVIIGTTGPLLLFDEALFQFCRSQEINFLAVRLYIGIWLIIIGLTVSAFEGSTYVRLLTRFTQEIFSALITLIYIVETFMKLVIIYQRHPLSSSSYINSNELMPSAEALIGGLVSDYDDPSIFNSTDLPLNDIFGLNETTTIKNISDGLSLVDLDRDNRPRNQPNTALFCTFLTLGTFAIAYYLKLFRNSHFLGRNARRALGDFGVPIAIALFVGIDYLIQGVYTEKLKVPEGLSPSLPGRSWLVSLSGTNEWIPFLAAIPAVLVYILIFMETHISELIVDKPERGLKKGSGLHFDIVLLSFLNCICGSLGMPWHCAATVRSVAHVSAVTIMSRTHAPGESPRIIDVKEQRVSGLFVSIMVGLSVLMTPLLRLIPMAVLFGVFLYMGIASMSGVQLFERITLYFMPTKHHPSTPYVKRVPTWKMHAFTTVQVFCLTVLWVVKSSIISLAFPFFLIMMVPLRFQLSRFYTSKEMNALDGTQAKIEADDEPDFYEQAGIVA
ncbi:anion exchange protein 2 isoform X2 [Condylostylus longicornis]|uniref:anion exchange protein 2 isoform X2 n=1 Tax=Condylostylus longicornis TaxID=2530218 RepID=UPI00244DEF2A|nr:anion exchange protein 2 isoform X2 [Condylostylus longicornis]